MGHPKKMQPKRSGFQDNDISRENVYQVYCQEQERGKRSQK